MGSTDSMGSSTTLDADESENGGEDRLTKMRRMLLESMAPTTLPPGEESSTPMDDKGDSVGELSKAAVDSTSAPETSSEADTSLGKLQLDASGEDHGDGKDGTVGSSNGTEITIIPPTPTTLSHEATVPIAVPTSSDGERQHGSLPAEQEAKPSPTLASHVTKSVAQSSGQSTPQFSPWASLRNSPDTSVTTEQWETDLEDDVRRWASQIVQALEHLHSYSLFCRLYMYLHSHVFHCILTFFTSSFLVSFLLFNSCVCFHC